MKKISLLLILFLSFTFTACSEGNSSPNSTPTQDTDYDSSYSQDADSESVAQTPAVPLSVTNISAAYDGSTKAGTILNEDNEGIEVTAVYSDGSNDTIYDFSIANPTTLRAGKKSTITIQYQEKKCKLSVKCTTLTKSQFKQQCKNISYKKLSRTPKKYKGKKVKFTGKIIQVMEDEYSASYRIDVTKDAYGFWDDTVYVDFYGNSKKRLLEDDIVNFWGTYDGLYTYTSVLGSSVTIPSVTAKYMELVK